MSVDRSTDEARTSARTSTLARRIVRGEVLRRGALGAYHALRHEEGEPHVVREDLLPGSAARWRARPARRRPLLALAHVTDLQIADVQSPARFEFFNREYADPRFADLVPVQRPQEAFTPHAAYATVETLNRLGSAPVGGGTLSIVVTTGDAIDNAQWNELQTVLALFDGGLVRPRSGGPRYDGVQSTRWPDEVFWRPDGPGPDGRPDLFRSAYAFPHAPGILDQALETFPSEGLRVPWLACYGNHEALIQGVGRVTPAIAAALVDAHKPTRLPERVDLDRALETFITAPHRFLEGHRLPITPDADRRPMTRREFVAAHLPAPSPAAPGAPAGPGPFAGPGPAGHGFTPENLRRGTAYYVHDLPGVRLIGLDTTRSAGAAGGALDTDQLWWLQARLVEVHSAFRAPDGETVTTSAQDRLVIVFSHHGTDTLSNLSDHGSGEHGPGDHGSGEHGPGDHGSGEHGPGDHGSGEHGPGEDEGAGVAQDYRPPDDPDLVGGPELLDLLHRFPNVVLWLNGHTHTNTVRARRDPADPHRGFWEVTTCAIVDWPCQSRVVELLDLRDGTMAIACTMVDYDGPLGPAGSLDGSPLTGRQLAGLHRELAANMPMAGAGSSLEGTPDDRNVVLPLRAPFDLRELPRTD